jgi:hypothetical protein
VSVFVEKNGTGDPVGFSGTANVVDGNAQEFYDRKDYVVHSSTSYLGVSPARSEVRSGEGIGAEFAVVARDSIDLTVKSPYPETKGIVQITHGKDVHRRSFSMQSHTGTVVLPLGGSTESKASVNAILIGPVRTEYGTNHLERSDAWTDISIGTSRSECVNLTFTAEKTVKEKRSIQVIVTDTRGVRIRSAQVMFMVVAAPGGWLDNRFSPGTREPYAPSRSSGTTSQRFWELPATNKVIAELTAQYARSGNVYFDGTSDKPSISGCGGLDPFFCGFDVGQRKEMLRFCPITKRSSSSPPSSTPGRMHFCQVNTGGIELEQKGCKGKDFDDANRKKRKPKTQSWLLKTPVSTGFREVVSSEALMSLCENVTLTSVADSRLGLIINVTN